MSEKTTLTQAQDSALHRLADKERNAPSGQYEIWCTPRRLGARRSTMDVLQRHGLVQLRTVAGTDGFIITPRGLQHIRAIHKARGQSND